MGKPGTTHKTLQLEGMELPLRVQRNARARRMTLRLDHRGEALQLVIPRYTPMREALDFAASQADWVARRLEEALPRIAFLPGVEIPILGEAHQIVHLADAKRGVWLEPGQLYVSGRAEHLPRRIEDFLKRRSRTVIVERAHDKAERLGQSLGRITMRDTRSRWGSCSEVGDMSFSWRLILAPDYVLDYVVAHEIAHLVEMNHGDRFWRLTASITERMAAAKTWLRRNGASLYRYG